MSMIKKIGAYHIIRQIGVGGMGRVFEGRHESIGQRAAIKVLHPQIATQPEFLRRFLNEARASSAIDHPGIVRIFDFGQLPDGSAYLIMEYLDGESLGQRIARLGRLPLKDALRAGRQLAATLAVAHQRGIVHRDLKPENVHIIRDSEALDGERMKILDFGIAKISESAADSAIHTRTGAIMGTPRYMSPEQCRGAGDVTDRSDVYSLGIMLYEMLTGTPPFTAHRALELLQMHVAIMPVPLRTRDPAVPALVSDLVERMLAKEPAARPTMLACAATLEQIEGGRPPPEARTVFAEAIMAGPGARGDGAPRPPAGILRRLATRLGRATPANNNQPGLARASQPSLPPEQPGTTLATELNTRTVLLRASLPEPMHPHAAAIDAFLLGLFASYEPVTPGVMRLGQRRPSVNLHGEDYFAIFMAEEDGRPGIGTRTFAQYTAPLEGYLKELDRDLHKVVLVITDTLELGRGVHDKIFKYHDEYNATILPFYLGQVRRSGGRGAEDLVRSKLNDLHVRANPFDREGALRDPLRFFGMAALRHDLRESLRHGGILALYGPPGTGKSAVLQRIEYELPDARFVRIDSRGLSSRDDLAVALCARLPGPPPLSAPPGSLSPDPLLAALERATDTGLLVLCLDDADGLLQPLEEGTEQPGSGFRQALGMWEALAEHALPGRMTVVCTAPRAFVLGERQLGGRTNPLAGRVHLRRMPGLNRGDVQEMLARLGSEVRVSFAPRAMAALHRLSAGHMGLLRLLCSQAIEARGGRSEHSFSGEIAEAAVRAAAAELAAFPDTLWDVIGPCLTEIEQQVLKCIARYRPRRRELRKLLGLPERDVLKALGCLHKLGLVRHIRGRLRVSLPLLDLWAGYEPEGSWRGLPLAPAIAAGALLALLAGLRFVVTAPSATFLCAVAVLGVGLWWLRDRAGDHHGPDRALGGVGSVQARTPGRPSAEAPGAPARAQAEGSASISALAADAMNLPAPVALTLSPAVLQARLDVLSPIGVSAAPISRAPTPVRASESPQHLTMIDVKASRPVRVFLGYAQEDDKARVVLEKHLSVALRSGAIELWHRQQIEPGQEWSKALATKLEQADLVLLLVSQDFLMSEEHWKGELEQALRRHEAGLARVIPILVRPSDWRNTDLRHLQPLPRDGRPLSSKTDAEEALQRLVAEIWDIAKRLRARLSVTPEMPGERADGTPKGDPIPAMARVPENSG